ncbi:MAG: ABC transporter ATP-binding protein [Gammaproteobacteria bacterium]
MTHLAACEITVTAGDRLLVEALDLSVGPGDFVAILGRNGAGKTTTLLTLAGLAAPDAGEVQLDGVALNRQPRREIARRIGLLMQDDEDVFPATVMETALIGRHPHLDFWQWEGPEDKRIAQRALRRVGLENTEARTLDTLSGGERRRLALATLLVQDPAVALLDEPTSHLDPQYQLGVMQILRERADQGRCVVACLHDLNAAARFCDQCLLLFGDGRWLLGTTAEVLNEQNLGELYGLPMRALETGSRRIFFDA